MGLSDSIILLDMFVFMCAYFGIILCLMWPLSISVIHYAEHDAKNEQSIGVTVIGRIYNFQYTKQLQECVNIRRQNHC
jgi:hypothetical protein